MSDESTDVTDESTVGAVDDTADEFDPGLAPGVPTEHPSRGNRLAIGDEERVFLYDTADDGSVINFRAEDEDPEEARLAKRPPSHSN